MSRKAAVNALKPLFKSIGRKISAKFAADGMDHAIASNIGKKIDEAVEVASEGELKSAAGSTKNSPSPIGRPPRTRFEIDRDIEAVLNRRKIRLAQRGVHQPLLLDLDELSELVDVGSLLIERGAMRFKDWSSAMTKRFGSSHSKYLVTIFNRIRARSNKNKILDDLKDIGIPSNPLNIGRVVRVRGDEFGRNLNSQQTRQAARAYTNTLVGKIVKIAKDGRAVEISRDASSKTTNVLTKAKLTIAMEEILRSAQFVQTVPDTRGRAAIWHKYLSSVELAGVRRKLILRIREDQNGNLFYDWNFEFIKS